MQWAVAMNEERTMRSRGGHASVTVVVGAASRVRRIRTGPFVHEAAEPEAISMDKATSRRKA